MNPPQPTVLDGISVTDFVQYVLDHHSGPSTIVVCSTKHALVEQLQTAIALEVQEQTQQDLTDHDMEPLAHVARPAHRWSSLTLRLLAVSRTVKLAFCPDLTHLRAYLAVLSYNSSHGSTKIQEAPLASQRILAVLNPIQLHRPTSAFSAQGINRTFSTAVEAAHYSGCQLLIAECSDVPSHAFRADAALPHDGDEDERSFVPEAAPPSIWDQDVSILNVATKTFGAGERGWVGRTVPLRTIAARWCAFNSVDSTARKG